MTCSASSPPPAPSTNPPKREKGCREGAAISVSDRPFQIVQTVHGHALSRWFCFKPQMTFQKKSNAFLTRGEPACGVCPRVLRSPDTRHSERFRQRWFPVLFAAATTQRWSGPVTGGFSRLGILRSAILLGRLQTLPWQLSKNGSVRASPAASQLAAAPTTTW